MTKSSRSTPAGGLLAKDNAAQLAAQYIRAIEPYPERFHGRGIVTCAGGVKYNTCAYVLIGMLRKLGCRLPIQAWYLGETERDDDWIALVRKFGVECVDAREVCREHPHPGLAGWPLKPYSILRSPFEEVLFLDADNVPVLDPTFLFQQPPYRTLGAVFWPDGLRTPRLGKCWQVFGVPYRNEWELETGQILINKRACWRSLNLCNWYNERWKFFYRFVYGDKDTFRFAWHRLGQPYAMPTKGRVRLPHTLCQHDFAGRRIFQHRCLAKWSLGDNRRVPEFTRESECLELLEELRRTWDPVRELTRHSTREDLRRMDELTGSRFDFVRIGHGRWPLTLNERGRIGMGRRQGAFFWWLEDGRLVIAGADGRPTFRLRQRPGEGWEGHSAGQPKTKIRLVH